MTDQKPSSKTLPAILIVAALILLAVGAWFVLGGKGGGVPEDAAVIVTDDQVVDQTEEAAIVEGQETVPDAVPDTSVTSTTEEPAPTATAGSTEINLEQAMSVRAIGNPNAPVKMIEYASLTCSHCAHFHNEVLPKLKTDFVDTGKLYIEFREFPLNDPALKATLTARCLPADKYDGFVSLLFKTQEQWAGGIDYMQALKQNAKLAGMSDETFEACHASGALKEAVAAKMQEANDKWKLNATPTFIINDGAEVISGAKPVEEFERIFRKVSGDTVGEAPAVE